MPLLDFFPASKSASEQVAFLIDQRHMVLAQQRDDLIGLALDQRIQFFLPFLVREADAHRNREFELHPFPRAHRDEFETAGPVVGLQIGGSGKLTLGSLSLWRYLPPNPGKTGIAKIMIADAVTAGFITSRLRQAELPSVGIMN
ncbi:MAG TPA: hypothetical protein VLU73_10970 [Methylococcaceae bacterium]|nr:hypothetical protein [Methylococcaceae bacterium]